MLRNACFAGSDEVVYFSIMLKVLVSEGFDRDRVLSDFDDLFVRQRLARCRDAISADGFLFNWEQLELRLMPPGLAYKFTCPSEGACALSNRIHNAHLPPPGTDDDYDMVKICLWCRLDVKLIWFLGHFHFF